MSQLEVVTTEDSFQAYSLKEGDTGGFLRDENDATVGYVPYDRLVAAKPAVG